MATVNRKNYRAAAFERNFRILKRKDYFYIQVKKYEDNMHLNINITINTRLELDLDMSIPQINRLRGILIRKSWI